MGVGDLLRAAVDLSQSVIAGQWTRPPLSVRSNRRAMKVAPPSGDDGFGHVRPHSAAGGSRRIPRRPYPRRRGVRNFAGPMRPVGMPARCRWRAPPSEGGRSRRMDGSMSFSSYLLDAASNPAAKPGVGRLVLHRQKLPFAAARQARDCPAHSSSSTARRSPSLKYFFHPPSPIERRSIVPVPTSPARRPNSIQRAAFPSVQTEYPSGAADQGPGIRCPYRSSHGTAPSKATPRRSHVGSDGPYLDVAEPPGVDDVFRRIHVLSLRIGLQSFPRRRNGLPAPAAHNRTCFSGPGCVYTESAASCQISPLHQAWCSLYLVGVAQRLLSRFTKGWCASRTV